MHVAGLKFAGLLYTYSHRDLLGVDSSRFAFMARDLILASHVLYWRSK